MQNSLLSHILLDEQSIADKFVLYQAKCNDLKLETSNLLNRLLEQKRLLIAKKQEIRSLGDSKGMENEIKALKAQKDGIEKQCALDSVVLKSFEEDNVKVRNYARSVEELCLEIESVERLSTSAFLVENQSISYDGIREQTKAEVKNTISDLLKYSNDNVRNKIVSLKVNIVEQRNTLSQKMNGIISSEAYKKGKSLYDTNIVLSNIRKRLDEQESLLAEVNAKKDEHKKMLAEFQVILGQLLDSFSLYLTLTNAISSVMHIEHDDVKLCSSVVVVEKLYAFLADSLNLKYKEMGDLIEQLMTVFLSKSDEQLKSVLSPLVYKAIGGELKFKGSTDDASFLTILLTNN